MSIQVIGTGVGRTGTLSLKLALTELGLGPCYHMTEVMEHLPVQLPLWQAAVSGKPNFAAIYEGYASAVDWPTAGFFVSSPKPTLMRSSYTRRGAHKAGP